MSESWSAERGRLPDDTLPGRITIRCDPPDRIGKCHVCAHLDGQTIHHHVFNPYDQWQRRQFAEAVYAKAVGIPPEDHFDLGWLGDAVIAAASSVSVSTSTARDIEPYKPFPVHVLPTAVADYVRAASRAIGCDPSFIALPLLACLARAIGNKRVIRLKRTWIEPAIIWAAIIGKSGTSKTPAMQAVMIFLNRAQATSIADFQEAVTRSTSLQVPLPSSFQALR